MTYSHFWWSILCQLSTQHENNYLIISIACRGDRYFKKGCLGPGWMTYIVLIGEWETRMMWEQFVSGGRGLYLNIFPLNVCIPLSGSIFYFNFHMQSWQYPLNNDFLWEFTVYIVPNAIFWRNNLLQGYDISGDNGRRASSIFLLGRGWGNWHA